MGKKLNLSTEKGCRKTLAILLCIVLLASLFGLWYAQQALQTSTMDKI